MVCGVGEQRALLNKQQIPGRHAGAKSLVGAWRGYGAVETVAFRQNLAAARRPGQRCQHRGSPQLSAVSPGPASPMQRFERP
jgi:hypothetical protein